MRNRLHRQIRSMVLTSIKDPKRRQEKKVVLSALLQLLHHQPRRLPLLLECYKTREMDRQDFARTTTVPWVLGFSGM